MRKIMPSVAALVPSTPRVRKKKGAPTNAPRPKQINCRFVNPKATFVLICDRSLGMVT